MKDGWESIACNICGTNDSRLLYKSNFVPELVEKQFSQYSVHENIIQCRHCGLVYESPREKCDVLALRISREPYPIKEGSLREREVFFRSHIRSMKKNIPLKGRLLDVGSNIGDFLALIRREGLDVYGLEPSLPASEIARRSYGLNIVNDVAEKGLETFSDSFFDIVTIWDVIEHLQDPANVMKIIHKKLKKGGVLCIATHNIGSIFAHLTRGAYPHFMYQHLYHFSEKTIATLLKKAGFDVIKIEIFNKVWSLGFLSMLLREFFPLNKTMVRFSRGLEGFLRTVRIDQHIVSIPVFNDMRVYARKA